MAQPVYSTLFVAAVGTDLGAGYVVPGGHLAVVRDVALLFDGTPEDTAAGVYDVTTLTWIAYHLMVDAEEYWHWEGRQIVPAGAEFQLRSAGPNAVSGRVSGYLLTLP